MQTSLCARQVRVCTNLVLKRTSFMESQRHGPHTKKDNFNYLGALKGFFGPDGAEFIKKDVKNWFMKQIPSWGEMRVHAKPMELNIIHKFDTEESISDWIIRVDSDTESGSSKAEFFGSSAGHGIFQGHLDTRIPQDGITIKSGFVAMIGPMKPFEVGKLETHWDWDQYNTLEIKFRGDGRRYRIVINTSTDRDNTQYFDMYMFPIYTKGGPYWQTLRIPFTKFIFGYRGVVQDNQDTLNAKRIRFTSIVLEDNIDGPFKLEIAHIGLLYEPLSIVKEPAYELYRIPHIDRRPLHVGSFEPVDRN